ncbi:hypothetical protein ACSSVQ_002639 [Parvibaculum sp. MBR-TMA-1.3b-4.2]|jgi:hypothetical protein
MSGSDNEIATVIDALQAVRLVREHYASGVEGAKRVSDICDMLETADTNMNRPNGLRTNVAAAIRKSYL